MEKDGMVDENEMEEMMSDEAQVTDTRFQQEIDKQRAYAAAGAIGRSLSNASLAGYQRSPEEIAAQEKAEAEYRAMRLREIKREDDRVEREVRAAALQIANIGDVPAEQIVQRAEIFLGFLKGVSA